MADFISQFIEYNEETNRFDSHGFNGYRQSYYFDSPEGIWVEIRKGDAHPNNAVVVGGGDANDYQFYNKNDVDKIFDDIEDRFSNTMTDTGWYGADPSDPDYWP